MQIFELLKLSIQASRDCVESRLHHSLCLFLCYKSCSCFHFSGHLLLFPHSTIDFDVALLTLFHPFLHGIHTELYSLLTYLLTYSSTSHDFLQADNVVSRITKIRPWIIVYIQLVGKLSVFLEFHTFASPNVAPTHCRPGCMASPPFAPLPTSTA